MLAPIAIAIVGVSVFGNPIGTLFDITRNALAGLACLFLFFLLWNRLRAPRLLDTDWTKAFDDAHQRHQEEQTRSRETIARLEREVDTVGLLRAIVERTGIAPDVNASIERLTRQTRPDVTSTPHPMPLSAAYVEDALIGIGYPANEARAFRVECMSRLRAVGIRGEARAAAFFADAHLRDDLERLYLNDLRRDPAKRPGMPLVDPRGLTTWGLQIYLAPPEERDAAIVDVRDTLRVLREAGAE